MKRFPLVTAHTGCMGLPDHSIASLQTALAYGVDIYEDDVRVTQDGELVLAHDDEVQLANGRLGSVAGMKWAELSGQAAEPLVSLEYVLRIVKESGIRMNLDIKTASSLQPLFILIESLDMVDQVILSGCNYEAACLADGLSHHVNKLLNVDAASFQSMSYTDAVLQACEHSRKAGCFGLNVPYCLVRTELLERAEAECLDVYVWTVSDEADMRLMAELGVASITTRNVDRLMEVRKEWERL
ncbi:glycerophosphodiester phosphodiesterase [Paenibacillus senegalensis]|uniref:glycerophosphodiester phosphodiesterase n=1 Tax=Paenibacillus senegalensis TaxID=1465766 RepID=UPI0002894894|nr:glycerophosphodiester phosphodiesterase family protein [Paenibacillus senegalensis]